MSGVIIEKINSDDLDNASSALVKGYIKIKYSNNRWKNFKPTVMIPKYIEVFDKKKELKVYGDDVFVCTFPRCGTSLIQEMTWLILNDLDFESAKNQLLSNRSPELEFGEGIQQIQTGEFTDIIPHLKRPRIIKTHLPVHMLPDQVWDVKPKLIHVKRDVKDIAMSRYNIHKSVHYSPIDLKSFLEAFLQDRLLFAPYREHLYDYLNIKDYENILYLTYEEMFENIEETIKKVGNFLGKTLNETNMQAMKKHLEFDSMKTNESCNNRVFLEQINKLQKDTKISDRFIVRSVTENHREEMPEEFINRFDRWMNEKVASGWDGDGV